MNSSESSESDIIGGDIKDMAKMYLTQMEKTFNIIKNNGEYCEAETNESVYLIFEEYQQVGIGKKIYNKGDWGYELLHRFRGGYDLEKIEISPDGCIYETKEIIYFDESEDLEE